MRSRFWLPKSADRDQVAAALKFHRDAGLQETQQKSIEWTRSHWFIQGVRGLRLMTPRAVGGLPAASFNDPESGRKVRLELAVQNLQTELGRLLAIDVSPAVQRRPGISLDDVRASGISQIVLDNFWDRFKSQDFRIALAFALCVYGTVGIGAFDVPRDSGGVYGASLFLIPPWELLPLPAGTVGPDSGSGLMWRRWVPLDWLRENYGNLLKLPANDAELGAVEIPAGSHAQTEASPANDTSQLAPSASSVRRLGSADREERKGSQETIKYVEFLNAWETADDGSCLRWMVMVGDKCVIDKVYTGDEKPVCPIAVARYLPVGSFYGRSLVDRLISLNKELELFLGDMLQNMREADRLRCLMIPATGGINMRNLKQYLRNRVVPYQPDLSAPSLHPEILAPPTVGDVHGRVVGMLAQFMGNLASQGDMFRGGVPGRLDSADSLAIVAEQQGVPMGPVVESIDGAMSQAFKALLGIFRQTLKSSDVLTLSRIDESVIGVVFDQSNGQVGLAQNPIPQPQTVKVGIRSKTPRSKQAILAALDGLLVKKLTSPVNYRISAQLEDLGLPLTNRAEYDNYVCAWLENLVLFGDGKTPGQPLANQYADNHAIHFAVHMAFMAKVLFRIASPQVRDAFIQHARDYHLTNLGAFPESLESPDQFGNVAPPNPAAMMGMAGMMPPRAGMAPPEENFSS